MTSGFSMSFGVYRTMLGSGFEPWSRLKRHKGGAEPDETFRGFASRVVFLSLPALTFRVWFGMRGPGQRHLTSMSDGLTSISEVAISPMLESLHWETISASGRSGRC